MTEGTWLVVGLGNPGSEYARTRHNVGQAVLDELATRAGSSFKRHRSQARVAEVRLGTLPGGAPGPRAVLAAPTSYMNVSGGQVSGLARYYGVDVENLVVVHDELDVDFGAVRLKRGGGEGGHNGLRSISQSLGSKDYARVRVGIGRPPGRQDPADFVLKEFSTTERKELPFLLSDAADAVELLLTQGLEPAQQRFHSPA
ncbi:aminoacyl-tRNA hydrolase [Kineococcus rubinsiae]|uniref:aminoacyl-tRNA hydrolase n=1 Tax=Kineococcus rubinsiae TaxID=2609562 RepID=UPI00142FED13|nr:aminoacyl-tRNA hydrolase [Kineococcus rubinsiae]NIZ92164.1 aminoacyl-tRNA hydrolase [Kineococcus rubinsiae]